MKFSGRQCRLVKLQRPPPEIRIFLPTRSLRSSTTTRRPRLPASMAHIRPAAPAPRTIASKLLPDDIHSYRTVSKAHHRGDGSSQRIPCPPCALRVLRGVLFPADPT